MYSGAPYQRGYDLGGVMKNIMRQATLLLKHAGWQTLQTGISVHAAGGVLTKQTVCCSHGATGHADKSGFVGQRK